MRVVPGSFSSHLGHWGYVEVASALTISREIGISALREWMAEKGLRANVKVGTMGKWKTTFQMAAISQLIGKAETAAGLDVSLQFASNAVEAVEASAQNNIDLVLLDFLLPGGRDGATALPEIRENIGKASSIIMISGSAQEAPMRACLSNGADSFRLNTAINCVHDLIRLVPAAAGDAQDVACFASSGRASIENDGMSHAGTRVQGGMRPRRNTSGTACVDVTTVDAALGRREHADLAASRPALLKIDNEGNELATLRARRCALEAHAAATARGGAGADGESQDSPALSGLSAAYDSEMPLAADE